MRERRRSPSPVGSAPIWQLSLAYWVCGVTTASITVHCVRWAMSEGIAPTTAALAFGLLSVINTAGVLAIGALSDRLPRRVLLGAVYLTRALAFVLLLVLPGPAALWAFAIVGGASWLATVPLTSSLTADVYGLPKLGTLVGIANFFHQVGGALAVYLYRLWFRPMGFLRLGVPGWRRAPGCCQRAEPQHPRVALVGALYWFFSITVSLRTPRCWRGSVIRSTRCWGARRRSWSSDWGR